MQYENMLIMTKVVKLEDSFDLESMDSGRKHFSEYLHQLNKKYQITTRKMMIFGVGSCELCHQCTYPEAECRHPLEKFIALEAAGIDVASLAQTAKVNYYNGKNTVTYFAAILYHEDR
jgi:predicted metal-binding protein